MIIRNHLPALSLAAVLGGLLACAGCGGGAETHATTGGSSSSASGGDAGPAADRGPTSLTVDGDPNGLFWDDATDTLYIADSDNNRVLTWTDAARFASLADLPKAPQDGPGLGQLVKTADGTLVVVRFGFGTVGDVVFVEPGGTTGTVPNLDPQKRRIGLTVAPDGTLFDGYFVKSATSDYGAVARLDLKGTEIDVIQGLDKPIGVLAIGGSLYVTDQGKGTVLVSPLGMPDKDVVLAMLDEPDLLCPGPNGSIYTGGADIRQITADGTVTTFASGFSSVRGVAYDPTHRRVFASNHSLTGGPNKLEIRPVD